MAPPPATMESFWKWAKRKSAHLPASRGRTDGRTDTNKPTDLGGSADDHDGIVQRSLRLFCELLRPAPQDDGARLSLRAALKEVIPAGQTQRLLDSQRLVCSRDVLFLNASRLASLRRPGPLRRARTVPGHRLSWHRLRSGWSRRKPGGHVTCSQSCSCSYRRRDRFATVATIGLGTQMWCILHLTIMVLLRSSSCTLPAQNRSLSAKYWVATSPIGNLDKTTLAPDL